MVTTSEQIGALATAMALMQAEIENVTKDRVNTFFAKDPNSKPTYATLAAVLDVCRPALAKHDLSVVQFPGNDGAMVTVTTRLMHKSGEWLESTCGAVPMKADAQQVGSVVTYLRRYSLASLCAVTQDDDDGNAASAPQSHGNSNNRPATAPQQQSRPVAQPAKPVELSTSEKEANKQKARVAIRQWVDVMGLAEQEAGLLRMLDDIDSTELKQNYNRLQALNTSFQATFGA